MAQNTARVLYHDTFEGKGFTDANSLVNALLIQPDTIDPILTHLMGKESSKFPLSFLSEGQVGGSSEVNDTQYEYNVINKINRPDIIISSPYTSGDKPGLGGSVPIFITMKTSWNKKDHTVMTESYKQLRVVNYTKDGLYWRYEFDLYTSDPNDYVPLTDLAPGKKIGMVGGANVTESQSDGNESNVVMPGKMKQQCSLLRKSYRLAGNISNKVVEIQFNVNGKSSRLWVDFERWQHMMNWKQSIEEHCWWSEYNRAANGVIINKDRYNGLPVPRMAGLVDQIPNSSTFGFLTAKIIKTTVRDTLFGMNDDGPSDIALMCGTGFADDFDTAMKDSAAGFTQIMGDKFVTGSGRNLVLGGFFTAYQHIDGQVVTVHKVPLFDKGEKANIAPKHPISGLPMTSHDGYFIDVTSYDGARNLVMRHEKGRSMITGILKGMAPTPDNFAGNNINVALGTERDESSVHFMASKSILLRRNTNCFKLLCDLS